MLINKQKIAAAIATGSLLLSALTPLARADTTLEVIGNGDSSVSNVSSSSTSTSTVSQSNTATVTNTVTSHSTSGGNEANSNTGGTVAVDAGAASSTTHVTTSANLNKADSASCGCPEGKTTVTISGNGVKSTNDATVNTRNTNNVSQDNTARISNNVYSHSESGDNEANRNTGSGVTVTSGAASSTTTINNKANANVASMGGSGGTGSSSVTATISGNGDSSRNTISLTKERSIEITQSNSAVIDNRVRSHVDSGDNEANSNTGGTVMVRAGMATSNVTIDNKANFNAADLGSCGYARLGSLMATISRNGVASHNTIRATRTSESTIDQGDEGGNWATFNNSLDTSTQSGDNEANKNTGSGTSVSSNSSTDTTRVSNSANVNVVGSGATFPLLEGFSLDLHFDLSSLSALLGMLGLHVG